MSSAFFGDRLAAAVAAKQSQIVLGLDPDPARLWPQASDAGAGGGAPAERAAAAIAAHCRAAIDATAAACVAVKPQLACFERLGAPGRAALGAVVEHARDAGLLVLADAKRGDIDVSAAAYAQSLVGRTPTPYGDVAGLDADAFTANPYQGIDSLESFIAHARPAQRGVIVLVRTSNAGAADLQDLRLESGERVWERVATLVDALGEPGRGAESGLADVCAVTGATVPDHLARLRELMPRTPFLLPGVGAQGGRVEDLAPAFEPGRAAGLVTSSRGIVNAYEASGGNPAAAASREAERLRGIAWSLRG